MDVTAEVRALTVMLTLLVGVVVKEPVVVDAEVEVVLLVEVELMPLMGKGAAPVSG